jgi:hypothetical protein
VNDHVLKVWDSYTGQLLHNLLVGSFYAIWQIRIFELLLDAGGSRL